MGKAPRPDARIFSRAMCRNVFQLRRFAFAALPLGLVDRRPAHRHPLRRLALLRKVVRQLFTQPNRDARLRSFLRAGLIDRAISQRPIHKARRSILHPRDIRLLDALHMLPLHVLQIRKAEIRIVQGRS